MSFQHYFNYSEILTLEKHYLRTGVLIESRRYESLVSTVNNSRIINSNFDNEYIHLIKFIENQLDSYHASVSVLNKSEPNICYTLPPNTHNLDMCSVQAFPTMLCVDKSKSDHNITPNLTTSSNITSNTCSRKRKIKTSNNESCRPINKKMYSTLPEGALCEMLTWFNTNISHPYPTYKFISTIVKRYELTFVQVKKWFANKRIRSGFTKI